MLTITKTDIAQLQIDELLFQPHVCNAPFISLNFAQTGHINVCCMSRKHTLGIYPETTILQAWTGSKIKELRKAIDEFNFSKGCEMCYKQIMSGNYQNSLLKAFQKLDNSGRQTFFPCVMEFEISSICNYECIMCGGMWSSSIRKNREKLPSLKSPYNGKFVKELEFFIPHLQIARFLGGEPFATPIYFDIWDKFIEMNGEALITITTNGSIFNGRVQDFLTRYKKVSICLSLDSLNPETYKFIRKNGNLDTVLKNIDLINTQAVGKYGVQSIAFCPMRQNWQEIPEIINFCRENKFELCFNNVEGHLGGTVHGIHENAQKEVTHVYDNSTNPEILHQLDQKIPEVSLFTLPEDEKNNIINFLENLQIPEKHYKAQVIGLINRLKWKPPLK